MLADGVVTEAQLQAIDRQIDAKVDEAVRFATESPYPLAEEALQDVWVEDAIAQQVAQ